MSKTTVQPLDARIKELNHLHDSCSLSWRKIAALPDFLGIPAGTLCAVAKGREPKKAAHRKILGLPPLAVLIEPCINPACDGYGQPHTFDCQTQSIIEKPAESKRVYNRKRPPRLSIDKFRAELAASSITGNTTPEYIDTLIELLDQWRDNQ